MDRGTEHTSPRYSILALILLRDHLSLRMPQSQKTSSSGPQPNTTITQDGDNDKNNNSNNNLGPLTSSNLINRSRPIVPIDSTTKSPAGSTSSKFDDIFRIQEHATATSTATAAATDNRSSTTTIANSKMTPQSPSLHSSSDPSEFDEFAAVPPTDPNITELSSGEVEVASLFANPSLPTVWW